MADLNSRPAPTAQEAEGQFPTRLAPAGQAAPARAVPEEASDPSATHMFSPPTSAPSGRGTNRPSIPGYRIEAELGRGNMGTVYRAFHQRLELEVALKVPHAHLVTEPAHQERFAREAQAAARLNHPNLCRVLEVGEAGDLPYLAMAYVPGKPLSQCPPDSPHACGRLLHTLAVALAEAHRLGVVHRDLKPSNILITPEGQPVVTDFGLALRLDTMHERLTQAGSVLGTPHYMAPEQARGDVAVMGPACDIYSLGVILYELLTGQLPFTGPGMMGLLYQVLSQEPPRPTALRPDLPPRLEAICLKAMAKAIGQRYPSMDALAEDLAAYLADPEGTMLGLGSPVEYAAAQRPLVAREVIRYAFAHRGERPPVLLTPADRLYLDVGNDLRAGVIDRHHRGASHGSTTSLVLSHPELVDGAVILTRLPETPFVLVLHERPDLDGIASAYLAAAYLATGRFPEGAEELAHYVDQVNAGAATITPDSLFSPCAAFLQLASKLSQENWNSSHERWQAGVRHGLRLIDFLLETRQTGSTPLAQLDAFACPDLFTAADRQHVLGDRERYYRQLADPRRQARWARLRLPSRHGGTALVEALLVRSLASWEDGERCAFFRDWARLDGRNCPNGKGFIALSVFLPEGAQKVRRCILSLTPDSGASFRGLGLLLEKAEAERRRQTYGLDDRVTDPITGQPRAPRPGYDNADPWYDGRAHDYTLVDSPRSGTLLRAEEIEDLFLRFGGPETPPEPLRHAE